MYYYRTSEILTTDDGAKKNDQLGLGVVMVMVVMVKDEAEAKSQTSYLHHLKQLNG